MAHQAGKLSAVEGTKAESRGLRGTVAAELAAADGRGGVSEGTYNLLKFHGTYEQFDRDTATELKQRGEDKDWQFMVRVRAPGGRLTAAQWLALDALADRYSDGTLRITTRQALQFHGVRRGNLKANIAAINAMLLTTFAACGDVVRNIVTTPAPRRDAIHARLEADARMLSTALLPRTRSYWEIFTDEAPGEDSGKEAEPLYGDAYLPRKFKIGIAHPADNTIDVLTNDLGLIAVFAGDRLQGYQVCVGGGLGMTHNRPDTYPRLATPVAFVGPDDLLRVAEAVIRLQRDHGDRGDRKRARLKYVLDDKGLPWLREALAGYYGAPLPAPREDLPPLTVPELLGWHPQGDGRCWMGVPVPSGRVADRAGVALRSAIRELVERYGSDPVLTPQQDLLLSNLPADSRATVEAILRGHGVRLAEDLSPLSRWALACPALPTCGLALTEAERVRQPIVEAIEAVLERHGLRGERISLRITGCPNGCARPYAGDIGLVGRVPGQFAIFVGGDFEGTRLSFKLQERVPQARIAAVLEPLFAAFAARRLGGEGFGDFCHRLGAEALHAVAQQPAAVAAE